MKAKQIAKGDQKIVKDHRYCVSIELFLGEKEMAGQFAENATFVFFYGKEHSIG